MNTTVVDNNMNVEEIDSFDFEGYQVVRGEFFAHIYEPSFTFNNQKVSVNMACLRKLPDIEFVQILVNPVDQKLAIRPCSEDEKDSFRWCSVKKHAPKQITARMFCAKVFSLMDWNPGYRYKLLGKLIKSDNDLLFVFDLKTPEIFVRSTNKKGKDKALRKPVYPEEWKNQFGLPVEEHKKSIQVNIFEGHAVFALNNSKHKTSAIIDTKINTQEDEIYEKISSGEPATSKEISSGNDSSGFEVQQNQNS